MGASQTTGRHQGQVLSDKPPPQATLPPEPPYPGPSAQYHFINTEVEIGTASGFSFTHTPMITSNIDTYYPHLAAQYAEGYRLLSFYRIPGQVHQTGLFKVSYGFQGIFCRYPTAPRQDTWQLRVEKSAIQLHHVFSGIIRLNQGAVVSDTSNVLDSIARNTQAGGRLVCVELTGEEQSASMSMAMKGISPLMGVDLFFEIPNSVGAQQYVYNCVSVPITVTIKMGLRPMPQVHCDWIGVLANNLNQGWRLVEIFMDKTERSRKCGFSGVTSLNSMWFFEKPALCMNDPTPRYEGMVIDHQVKIKQSFGGTQAIANWETLIQDMGNKGWELACILETPEVQISGLVTIYMSIKLFFQRPILRGFATSPNMVPSLPSDLPPPYDLVVGGMWGGGQGENAAAASSAPPPYSAVGGGMGDSGNPPPPPIGFEAGPPPPPPEKMGY